MRGPTRKPPKYRLHKPTGQAVVTIQGRDVYLGKHGSHASLSKYSDEVDRWRRSIAAAEPASTVRRNRCLSMGELILMYFKFAKQYYRENGQETSEVENLRQAMRPLRMLHGNTNVRDFGPLALKDVIWTPTVGQKEWFNSGMGWIQRTARPF